MSSTLLRGLTLLEAVDFYGPVSVAELSRRLSWDKATVSRVVTACEDAGWLDKTAGRITIGPRASLLGRGNTVDVAVRDAEPLVHVLSGVTGTIVQAYALIGSDAVALASAAPAELNLAGLGRTRLPLWASAAGKVIAAQLDPAELDRRLPADPFPDSRTLLETAAPPDTIERYRQAESNAGTPDGPSRITTQVRTRAELLMQLDGIRRDLIFAERGELSPNSCCYAVPWPRPGLNAAIACISVVNEIERNPELVGRSLRAAAAPRATRESIVTAAAAH